MLPAAHRARPRRVVQTRAGTTAATAACSGNRGRELYSRIFCAIAQPKVRKVGAWGLPRSCAEGTTGRFSRFWAPKKREKAAVCAKKRAHGNRCVILPYHLK